MSASCVSVNAADQPPTRFAQLEIISASLAAKVDEARIEIECSPERVKNKFESLSDEMQDKYLERFRIYSRAMLGALEEGVQNSELVFLWHILKQLGVRPSSRLFELLSEDHFIEIYDQSGIQIFVRYIIAGSRVRLLANGLPKRSSARWHQSSFDSENEPFS